MSDELKRRISVAVECMPTSDVEECREVAREIMYLVNPALAEAKEQGRNEALRDAAKVAETTFLGDILSPTTRISEAILSLNNTNTEEPK